MEWEHETPVPSSCINCQKSTTDPQAEISPPTNEFHDSGLVSMENPFPELPHIPLGNLNDVSKFAEEPDILRSINLNLANMCIHNTTQHRSSDDTLSRVSGLFLGKDNNYSDSINESSRSSSCQIQRDRVHGIEARTQNSIMMHVKDAVQIFQGNTDGDNILNISIIEGNTTLAHAVIKLAPEYTWLSYSNHLRQTPLHIAVHTRQPTIVRHLICAGASVKKQDHNGNTPLHLACALGYDEIVKHLLTPIMYSETRLNSYTIPFQRIPQDAGVRNYEGCTCLHLAVLAGHVNIVRMLLHSGAEVNARDGRSGRTALHIAADSNSGELLSLLLSRRELRVDAKDYSGATALHLALGRNHQDVVKMLLSHGARHPDSCEIYLDDDDDDDDEDDDDDDDFV